MFSLVRNILNWVLINIMICVLRGFSVLNKRFITYWVRVLLLDKFYQHLIPFVILPEA